MHLDILQLHILACSCCEDLACTTSNSDSASRDLVLPNLVILTMGGHRETEFTLQHGHLGCAGAPASWAALEGASY